MRLRFNRRPLDALAAVLILGAVAGRPARSQSAPGRALEGIWQGQWPTPNGSQELLVTVTERTGNRLAVLDAQSQGLRQVPVRATVRADSVFFDADRVNQHFAGARTRDGRQLRGLWRQGSISKPLTLQFGGTGDAAQPALVAAPPYRADAVSLTMLADNVRLAGTLTTPDGPGPFPALLLLNDFGQDRRDARRGSYQLVESLADFLARQGFAVLRLDDRGTGQSGGSAEASTVAIRTADATQALTWLRAQPRLDALRIGIFGHGVGGNIALQAAAATATPAFVVAAGASGQPGATALAAQPVMYGKELGHDTTEAARQRQRAAAQARTQADVMQLRKEGANSAQVELVLDQQRLRQSTADRKYAEANVKHQKAMLEIVRQTPNPALSQAIIANMMRQRYPALAPADAQATARQLTTPAYQDYLAFDPQRALAKVRCPVLLLFGTDDQLAPPVPNAELLLKGLKGNKAVTLHRLSGVNHALQAPEEEWLVVDGRPQPLVSTAAEAALRDWLQAQR
ncbi:pimeloyl-ACP methyl ester carboxylesterase [Hymenobacter sp. UYAg731]